MLREYRGDGSDNCGIPTGMLLYPANLAVKKIWNRYGNALPTTDINETVELTADVAIPSPCTLLVRKTLSWSSNPQTDCLRISRR